ncbi:zinc finger MYM-type protein 5 [Trichonephila clavipes]|nr:zinc finger MYM-type protein 5 [Trichonephila clavipes]
MRWELELNELRIEIGSIRLNVRRTSCVEDRKKTSSNYRISIGRAEEHMRETSPAVLMAEATIPVTTPIKEEKGMDYLKEVHVKVKRHEIGELKGSNMELNDLRHVVVPVSKNLVNDMLICSSDYEGLIENSQMVHNPAIFRETSKEEGIINSVNSKSVCSQEVVTDLLNETYTQSLLNVPNGDSVAVKIKGSNVQTNGQGVVGPVRNVNISKFIDSNLVQCCRDLITGIVKLELKAGLEVFKFGNKRLCLLNFQSNGISKSSLRTLIYQLNTTSCEKLDQEYQIMFPTGKENKYTEESTPIDADLREQILKLGPYQPEGNFQKDAKGRSISSSYYSFISKAGQKKERKWLCYSTRLHVAYCQVCWLFADRTNMYFKEALCKGVNDWQGI